MNADPKLQNLQYGFAGFYLINLFIGLAVTSRLGKTSSLLRLFHVPRPFPPLKHLFAAIRYNLPQRKGRSDPLRRFVAFLYLRKTTCSPLFPPFFLISCV
jgi:hypothetical protein